MQLVQAKVTRSSSDGKSEVRVDVQMTPLGSLVLAAGLAWLGYTTFRLLRRRLWLPVGIGIAGFLLRPLVRGVKDAVEEKQEG